MKIQIALITIIFFSFLSNSIYSQEINEGINEEITNADIMSPGPMHEILSKRTGKWKSDVKIWIDQTQEPLLSEGTIVRESIIEGRYFKADHTGSMMGMPYEGVEISGYDNLKKKFFSMWIDNLGTGVLFAEGTYDEGAKTITLNGTMAGPTGEDIEVREVIKLIDNDNSVFEMYVEETGKPEVKFMEIRYTRMN